MGKRLLGRFLHCGPLPLSLSSAQDGLHRRCSVGPIRRSHPQPHNRSPRTHRRGSRSYLHHPSDLPLWVCTTARASSRNRSLTWWTPWRRRIPLRSVDRALLFFHPPVKFANGAAQSDFGAGYKKGIGNPSALGHLTSWTVAVVGERRKEGVEALCAATA